MKKYLFGLSAIVLAISFSSFKNISDKSRVARAKALSVMDFSYTGTSTSYAAFTNAANWVAEDPGESCEAGNALPCHVQTNVSGITDVSSLVEYLVDLGEGYAEPFILNTSQTITTRGN